MEHGKSHAGRRGKERGIVPVSQLVYDQGRLMINDGGHLLMFPKPPCASFIADYVALLCLRRSESVGNLAAFLFVAKKPAVIGDVNRTPDIDGIANYLLIIILVLPIDTHAIEFC